MDSSLLKDIVVFQNKDFALFKVYVERSILSDVERFLRLPHILVITGLRRVGKSTLLREIRDSFFSGKQIYYFNFDNEPLRDFTAKDLNSLYELFVMLYGKSVLFFFDEIQFVPGWELFVRRMYDSGFSFIITGSNASLLESDLATKLTGRYIPLLLLPFSFKEFLLFKKFVSYDMNLADDRGLLKKHFSEYADLGGIPEYLIYGDTYILKTLYDNILYKDILSRHGLRDERSLKELSAYIFANFGNELSYNNLKKMLGLGSSNTVKDYISYMESSYLIFTISKYSLSVKNQIYSKKKIYVIDVGMIKAVSFNAANIFGKILENIVFLELKRRKNEVYYFREKHECDFLVYDAGRIVEALQVTATLNDSNKSREFAGLLEAMNMFNLREGIILTEDLEFEEERDGKTIHIIPIWKWLIRE